MPGIASALEGRLDPSELALLRDVSRVGAEHEVQAHLVGGTVRDILLGQRPADLDVSLSSIPRGFHDVLARELRAEVVARSEFGTVKLLLGDVVLDVAMARTETYASSGALPTVTPGSLQQDLERRDFAVNAMAVSLAENTWGELLDPFDGLGDLERQVIRVLHPKSFQDDATRILRAVRYAGRLGFSIEDETLALLRRDMAYLDTIKGDRVRHEFERIFAEGRLTSILESAEELGVLPAVYPSLKADEAIVSRMAALRTARHADTEMLPLALLAFGVPTHDLPGLAERLNMDTRWRRLVSDVGAVRDHFDELKSPGVQPSRLYEMLHAFSDTAIEACYMSANDSAVRAHLSMFMDRLRNVSPALGGGDLMSLGVPEGPRVGELLERLRAARLDGLLASREDEERQVVQWLRE